MTELQINDVIYRHSSHYGLNKYKITRVTKTRAYAGDQGFRRGYCDDGYLAEYPRVTGWNRDSYLIGTEQLQEEYTKQIYVKRVSDIKWEEFDTEVLMEIIMLTGEQL